MIDFGIRYTIHSDAGVRLRRDLGPGVHARVRPPRHRQCDRVASQHDRERPLDLLLDRPLAGLARPPGELAAVVLEDQPGARSAFSGSGQTSSSNTISVESERRGPSLRIRV